MRSHKVTSIALLVSVALTAIVSIVLLVFAAYSYSSEHDRRRHELRRVLDASADQIALGVALPAWNFDDKQVLSIMRAGMNLRDLHAIVIYGAGSKREHIVQRTAGGDVETGQPLVTTPDMLVAQRQIAMDGGSIGTVKVFATPAFMQQELREQRRANMLAILALAAVLVASVYGLLWFLILRPLKAVGQYVAGDTPQKAWFFGELRTLNESVRSMWALLESRYRAMRDSEERLSVATGAARIGIWDWDVEHDELAQDDETMRQYGLRSRLGGADYRSWLACIEPEDRERVGAEVAAVLQGEREFSQQFRIRRPDGAVRHLRSMARSFRDAQGKVVRVVGVSIDVTEATESEHELRRHRSHLEELVAERTAALSVALAEAQAANRARNAFLSNMSHELHAPLNSVIGFARLMAHSSTMSADEKRNMGIIHRSGQQLLAMVNDILELSRVEAGEVGLHREPVDAAQLLHDVCGMAGGRAARVGVPIELDIAELPRSLLLDGAKLRQVLLSLVYSMLKGADQGRILLSLRATALPGRRHGLAFAVRAGAHAADDHADVGLEISRQYVRIMGGELETESTAQGAAFRFTVEAEEAGALEPLASPPVLVPAHRGRRVLVVDDGADWRHMLRGLLEPAGFDVYEAANGVEALDAIARRHPDLVLMDWRMPELDGLEATRRLRADPGLPQPRVVMLTGSVFEEGRQQALAAGADEFLHKPVAHDKLFRVLGQQLGVQYVEGALS